MLPPGSETREPTATFELMLGGFERARSHFSEPVARRYRFGDRTVHLEFAGPAIADVLTPAIAHLEVGHDGPADLTIHLWDSASSGEPISPLLTLLMERIQADLYTWLTPRHEIVGITNPRVPATLDHWSGAFSVFDRATGRGVYRVEDATAVPYFERAAPLRTMLSWGLADFGIQSAHAAGVGSPDGGVLLAGPGGSGKSSTALRCLDAGLGHLADDYCLFALGDAARGEVPTAYSMYNAAKVDGPEDLAHLPTFAPHVVNGHAAGDEKLMLYLQRAFPDRLVTAFPIRAVLVPTVTDVGPVALEPISPATALRALGPTTLLQRPGAGGDALRAMGDLVRSVPCFALHLGTDRAAIPGVIEELLDR